VDRSAHEILDLQTLTGFGIAQLHGDETDQTISDVAARLPVIKAYRVRDQNSLDQARAQIQRLHTSGVDIYAALIDGYSAVAHGGTGVSVAQELVLAARGLHPRLILAGGLTPVNLGERLGWITPWAVDVASGVEVAPGLKSLEAVAAMLHTIADNVAGG
jgi:phosphoribosylanthranilate isomerase